MRARDLPKLIAPLPASLIWRKIRKYSTTTINTNGAALMNRLIQNWLAGWNSSGTLWSSKNFWMLSLQTTLVENLPDFFAPLGSASS